MPLTRDRSNGFVGLVSMICSCFMLCLFNYCMSINSLLGLLTSFNTPRTTLLKGGSHAIYDVFV